MSADRIRDYSGSPYYNPYSPPNLPAGGYPAGSASPHAPGNNASPYGGNPHSTFEQSGFDSNASPYARAAGSGTFEGPVTEARPLPPPPAPAPAPTPAPAPAAAANPHAQVDAMKTQMSLQEKKDFLKQFGVDEKHLKKAKAHEIENAFNQIVDQLKKPGQAELKFKIKGKDYVAKVSLDPVKGEFDIQIKQKKGFFGKVWDGIKKYGQIALTIASFIPGPIGVAARIANAVISSISAFAKGDILGGLAAAAGGLAGGAGAIAGKAISGVAKTVSTVATIVEKGALATKGVIDAVKNKNLGSLLTAVAAGASGVAGALGDGASKLASTMNEVSKWATRGNTALQAAVAAKNGDVLGALNAGSELLSGVAPKSKAADVFQRITSGATTAHNVYHAAKNGDILGALSAGTDFAANQLKDGTRVRERLEDVSAFAAVANKARKGDVLGAVTAGASYAATRTGEGTRARNTLNDVSHYAQTANSVHQAIRSRDYMGAAQALADLAADEVKDPAARRKLEKASQVLKGANVVEDAIQSKDYLAAVTAATALAGQLTGSDETQEAAKLLAVASDVRNAAKSKDPAEIAAALETLGQTLKDVTQRTQKRAVPAPEAAAPAPAGGEAPVTAEPLPSETATPQATPSAPATATSTEADAGQEYVIERGDTLAKIASRTYGDATRWAEVYAYNRDVLGKDPNVIAQGTRIQLPPEDFRLSAQERTELVELAARSHRAHAAAAQTNTRPGSSTSATSAPSQGGGTKPVQTSQGGGTKPVQTQGAAQPPPSKAALNSGIVKIVRNFGTDAPEKLTKLLMQGFGFDEAQTNQFLERLAKTGSGLKTLEKLIDAYGEKEKGNGMAAFAALAEAAGSAWDLLTEAQRTKVVDKMLAPLSGKFGNLASIMRTTKCADVMKVMSGFLNGKAEDVASGLAGVAKQYLTENKLGLDELELLIRSLGELLPKSIRKEMVEKMVAKKIPIAGTIVVGLSDAYSILKNPDDPTKKWALASTVLGAIPGVGTGASAMIDIGLLVAEVAENVENIKKELNVPPK